MAEGITKKHNFRKCYSDIVFWLQTPHNFTWNTIVIPRGCEHLHPLHVHILQLLAPLQAIATSAWHRCVSSSVLHALNCPLSNIHFVVFHCAHFFHIMSTALHQLLRHGQTNGNLKTCPTQLDIVSFYISKPMDIDSSYSRCECRSTCTKYCDIRHPMRENLQTMELTLHILSLAMCIPKQMSIIRHTMCTVKEW